MKFAKQLGASIILTAGISGGATASHITSFGAVDAIDHIFGVGGGTFAATPSSNIDDAWMVFDATAGDLLTFIATGLFGPNMVVFYEATNGIVEVGDIAGVTNFNSDRTGAGVDLIVQHQGCRGTGADGYVTPCTLSFNAGFTGQYAIGISPANENSAFVGTTTVQLSGNTSAVPEPATIALLGFGLAGLGWSRRKKA